MKDKYKLYIISCSRSSNRYVGITSQSIQARMRQHIWDAKAMRGKTAIGAAIRKHGEECFSIEHVASAPDKQSLGDLESLMIIQEKTFKPNGYNLTFGGDMGWMLCDERQRVAARKKAGESLRGRVNSPEHCMKISQTKKGKPLTQQNIDSIIRSKSRTIQNVTNGMIFKTKAEVIGWLVSLGYLKASFSPVIAACRGRSKNSYGFIWKYIDGKTETPA